MRRITQERQRRGWSQAKLARVADLNASTVCRIESGRELPYQTQIERLARALEFKEPPEALLQEVGN